MVPAETQEAPTDCLPKPQSNTQLDGPVTMASTNCQEENESIGHTSVTVPDVLTSSDCQERVPSPENQVCDGGMPPALDEDVSLELGIADIPQPCVSLAQAVFTGLSTLNVEDQEPEEFAFPFPDPASTLGIQGSARSDQGAQGTCSPPSLSEQLTITATSAVNHLEVVHEGGVQPPNSLYGGSTVNALADTSLPNNPMVQNPPKHLFSDPYEYELEKLRREEEYLKKSFEETTSKLMAELERKMIEAQSNYDREFKELDAAYKAKAMEEEVNRNLVEKSSLLANAFVSKCSERSECSDLGAIKAVISQQLIQRQQAVETNTHLNSTASPSPSVASTEAQILDPSFPPLHCNTTQPRPMSQQAAVQTNAHVNSTAAPSPSVASTEAQILDPSFPPRPVSQQAAVLTNTHVNSTAAPSPSVASTEAQILDPSFPPRPVSQQAAVQINTHVNSTAPSQPSVTTLEAPIQIPIPNLSGPRSHFPRGTTSQPRLLSQQPAVQSDTRMNSTAPPRPSVTAAEATITNPLGLGPFRSRNMTQQSPMSQQAVVQSNTNVNPTGLPRTSVTSEALDLHSRRMDTPHPRPSPVIPNLTPTAASSPPVRGIMRAPAPHIKRFRPSPAPISAPAAATTHPTRLVQEEQQGNSKGGLVYLSDEDE